MSHFEPQVALLCDSGIHGQEAYHPQYMTEQGRWQTDLDNKASCLKDKMDILDYCKKVCSESGSRRSFLFPGAPRFFVRRIRLREHVLGLLLKVD